MLNNQPITSNTLHQYLTQSHQDLIPLSNDTNYYQILNETITNFKEHPSKEQLLSSLTSLRRLLKYQQPLGLLLFDTLHFNVLEYIDTTEDSALLLNSLICSYEAFCLKAEDSQWISHSIKSLLKVASYNQFNEELALAALIANHILQKAANHSIHNNLFMLLVEHFCYEDAVVAKKAAQNAYDIVLMLDNPNRIKLIEWDYLIRKACETNLRKGNDEIYVTFLKNVKGLFNSKDWEEILTILEISTLNMFQLLDTFDMRTIIQKRKQIKDNDK